MATIDELRARAELIAEEQQIGGNTAERVGDAFDMVADIIEAVAPGDQQAVLYNPQSPNEAQKAQARENIGAQETISDIADFVKVSAQTFTAAQKQQARENIGAEQAGGAVKNLAGSASDTETLIKAANNPNLQANVHLSGNNIYVNGIAGGIDLDNNGVNIKAGNSGYPNAKVKVNGQDVATKLYVDGKIDDRADPIEVALAAIEAVIPSQASAQNQLADKNFVNSSISSSTANFVGTFNSLSELQAVQNPTNNDYGFVIETDAVGNEYYDRYKYNGQAWLFEYKVESTPFTAAQWAAIQSGITSALVTKLSALPTNAELTTALDAKADKSDTYTKAQVDAAIAAIDVSSQISGKADKVSNATNGDFAALNVSGNLVDSGKKATDFATAAQGAKADAAAPQATTYTKGEVDAALDGKADKSDTYTKTEVNNLIMPASTTIQVVATLPTTGSANTIYRVAGDPNAASYTDYGWDGIQFVPLAVNSNTAAVLTEAQPLTEAQKSQVQDNLALPVRAYNVSGNAYGWAMKVNIPVGSIVYNIGSIMLILYEIYGDNSSTRINLQAGAILKLSNNVGGIKIGNVAGDGSMIVCTDFIPLLAGTKNLQAMLGLYDCSTAANVSAKTISNIDGFALNSIGLFKVRFQYAHTLNGSVTLNINSTGSKDVYYNGVKASNYNTWADGETVFMYYDGTSYQSYSMPKVSEFSSQSKSINLVRGIDVINALFKSTNLYDKDDKYVVQGHYVSYVNGTLIANTSYVASGWIPVEGGSYYIGNAWQTAFFDINKNYISGVNSLSTAVQAPINAAYMRVSVQVGANDTAMIVEGSSLLPFAPYKLYLRDEFGVQVNWDDITNVSVEPIDTTFFELIESSNLIVPSEVTDNYYVKKTDGALGSNQNYKASGYIPVEEGAYYIGYGCYQTAFYNENKVFITGSGLSTISAAVQAPTGAAYMRTSIYKGAEFNNQNRVNKSNVLLPYEDYYKRYQIKEEYLPSGDTDNAKYETLLGADGISATTSSLSNGQTLSIDEFPVAPKKGNRISFTAKLTSFGNGFSIGKGTTMYGAHWWVVSDTEIKEYTHTSSDTIHDTRAHGLTFASYISVVIIQTNANVEVVLSTLSGTFSYTYTRGYSNTGVPFITSNGAAFTDVKLSATNQYFRSPMWAFGDSYFGIESDNREYYWLDKWGAANYLVVGYSGAGSSTMFSDLQKCLAIATPKYIIWALGMNDTNGASDISAWQQFVDQIIYLCEQKGITPIFVTIPTPLSLVSTGNKDAMSAYIRQSGHRYIDAADAVGSQSDGHWYGYGTNYDYQSSDNVHPSEYGARAIAERFCTDAPEIMQY